MLRRAFIATLAVAALSGCDEIAGTLDPGSQERVYTLHRMMGKPLPAVIGDGLGTTTYHSGQIALRGDGSLSWEGVHDFLPADSAVTRRDTVRYTGTYETRNDSVRIRVGRSEAVALLKGDTLAFPGGEWRGETVYLRKPGS